MLAQFFDSRTLREIFTGGFICFLRVKSEKSGQNFFKKYSQKAVLNMHISKLIIFTQINNDHGIQ